MDADHSIAGAGLSTTLCCDQPHLHREPVQLRIVGWRRQRTLAKPIRLRGRGLLYGKLIDLRLRPAAPNTGRLFVRTDLPHAPAVPALADQVTQTARRTVLGTPPCQVELVEHVLAALACFLVDNCILELTGPELPGWDGSVQALTEALLHTNTIEQDACVPVVTVERTLGLRRGQASITLYPLDRPNFYAHYYLDYGPLAPLSPQRFGCWVTPECFLNELAASRTFLLIEEVEMLRRQGVGLNTGLEQVLVFGPHGVLGNRLRWADEPARHKALDLLGDFALAGLPLAGQVFACRSGHSLNVALAQQILATIRTTELQGCLATPRNAITA